MERPNPPEHLREPEALSIFESAPQLVEWIEGTFLDEHSPLYDEAHDHLASAQLAALWTDVPNTRQQVQVIASAEIPRPPTQGGKWARGRWEMQMREWFGLGWNNIDFLLTFYAPYMATADDFEFCATVKHELCHAAQALDEYGGPKFRKDGKPVFAMRDHDFAGFLGVVRDFGQGAERNVSELVRLAHQGARIEEVDISRMCGTCLRLVS